MSAGPFEDDPFEDVAAVEDCSEGRLCGVRVDGAAVVLARVDGILYAMDGVCSHMSVLLEEGDLQGRRVRCPRHFAAFDVTTGEAVEPPASGRLATYNVRELDGRVYVGRTPRRS